MLPFLTTQLLKDRGRLVEAEAGGPGERLCLTIYFRLVDSIDLFTFFILFLSPTSSISLSQKRVDFDHHQDGQRD